LLLCDRKPGKEAGKNEYGDADSTVHTGKVGKNFRICKENAQDGGVAWWSMNRRSRNRDAPPECPGRAISKHSSLHPVAATAAARPR
jgi:hypothetical protein